MVLWCNNIPKNIYFYLNVIQLAYSESHKCNVAIKVISKKQKSARYLDKFLPREIEVVKGLKHENIIKYHESILTTHRYLTKLTFIFIFYKTKIKCS